MYMPEGVSPASGILQVMMRDIFQLYDEWSIVIFDNILLLAHDYKDAFDKLHIILKYAAEYVDNHAHLSPTRHRGELQSAETKVYTPDLGGPPGEMDWARPPSQPRSHTAQRTDTQSHGPSLHPH